MKYTMTLDILDETFDENIELYDRATHALRQCLTAYERRCEEIIHQIGNLDFENSQNLFDILQDIQSKLAKLLFVYDFPLGCRLDIFMREFDRIYDQYIRKYWHTQFSKGLKWPE